MSVEMRHKSLKSQARNKERYFWIFFFFYPEAPGLLDAEFFGKAECVAS